MPIELQEIEKTLLALDSKSPKTFVLEVLNKKAKKFSPNSNSRSDN